MKQVGLIGYPVAHSRSPQMHNAAFQALAVDVSLLPVGSLVMDMVFSAGLTPLLRAAQARGCFVFNGLSMLLYQGTLAFELWTGRDAPVEVMRAALGII